MLPAMSAGFSDPGLAAGFTFSAAPHLGSGMAVGNCVEQLACEEAIRLLRGSGRHHRVGWNGRSSASRGRLF
uniref:Gpm274 n=1 Tax=Arundo donax TaxID=35708 RepID=A0A0A9F0X4_ARUDO